jgi:serine phosphatase RsbU (regulator of sigma subunit)
MARKVKAFELWKAMSPRMLWRLAAAVFFMFSILGPLSILMESSIRTVDWGFVVVQCVGCGGLAASVVLMARRRWWFVLLVVVFWLAVIVLNAGGLSFLFGKEGFRVVLGNEMGVRDKPSATGSLTLLPEQLRAIYAQRGVLGVLAIALLVAGYIMFIRVMRAEVQQRSRLETEVRIAREIQESLLPAAALDTPWCAAAGNALPATEVGGDFFDIIPLPGDAVAFAIADVTGHGVGAGILGAMTKSALRSQLVHGADPRDVLANVNATLAQLSDQKTFVTFAYVLVDRPSGTVRYGTAGHPPVLLVRGAASEPLRTVNLALGMRADAGFATASFAYQPGDRLVLYTDGILEAANSRGEEFGADRLRRCVEQGPAEPRELCAALLKELSGFAGTPSFQDDVSVLAIRLS